MENEAITDILLRESGRMIPKEILRRSVMTDPMLKLVKQGSWPESMGYALYITQFERALPALSYSDGAAVFNPAYDSTNGFTDIGTGNFGSTSISNCAPKETTLLQGDSKTLFNMQGFAVNSQRFCATDLMVAFEGQRQFTAIKDNLAMVTNWILAEKFRHDYTQLAGHKYVVNVNGITANTSASGVDASFNDGGALQAAGAFTPSSINTQFLLEEYDSLNLEGASENSLDYVDGAPVHGLLLSHQLSNNLMKESLVRADFHWNRDRVPELLKALNATQPPWLGYQHIKSSIAPRWNYVAGEWVKVEPYIIKAANVNGWKVEKNPAYNTAAWEDTLIFHPDVMEIMWPGSVANPPGVKWDPVNYRGVWDFLNFRTATNQDGDTGYFRGRFMLGSMPKYVQNGTVVRHCRGVLQPLYSSCASYPA